MTAGEGVFFELVGLIMYSAQISQKEGNDLCSIIYTSEHIYFYPRSIIFYVPECHFMLFCLY